VHTPTAETCLHANPDGSRTLVRDAMNVMLWTVGVLIALMAVVIAALPMRRRDQSSHKPTVGSISGSWLTEYDAKHRHDRS
jgi:hypothetical protein